MNKILYHPKEGTTGFFLMRDVLKEPSEKEFSGDQWKEYDAHVNYQFHIQECKEEAINNGEIEPKSLKLLPVTLYHNPTLGLGVLMLNDPYKKLEDGDTFDLPEGLDIKESWENTMLYPDKKMIHLVPIKEGKNKVKESQEELWNDAILTLYTHGEDELKMGFIIQRK